MESLKEDTSNNSLHVEMKAVSDEKETERK